MRNQHCQGSQTPPPPSDGNEYADILKGLSARKEPPTKAVGKISAMVHEASCHLSPQRWYKSRSIESLMGRGRDRFAKFPLRITRTTVSMVDFLLEGRIARRRRPCLQHPCCTLAHWTASAMMPTKWSAPSQVLYSLPVTGSIGSDLAI
jgi:hypothetical protein